MNAASVADADAVKLNDIKVFFSNSKITFNNGPISLLKNCPDCTILDNWVFDNFILADESVAKGLWSLETCL